MGKFWTASARASFATSFFVENDRSTPKDIASSRWPDGTRLAVEVDLGFLTAFGIEAAVRGLHQLDLDSNLWTEKDVFDRMCIAVELQQEPKIHTVMVEKGWIEPDGRIANHRLPMVCVKEESPGKSFAPSGLPYHVCVVHSPVRTKNCKPSAKVLAGSVWQ